MRERETVHEEEREPRPRPARAAPETTTDAFGRFLTTSMLPKLAELWKQRRIVYFVATNHLSYFDPAIVRSERFDALILVPPPSFAAKTAQLAKILGTLAPEMKFSFTVTREAIEAELKNAGKVSGKNQRLRDEHLLAKFVLLRF